MTDIGELGHRLAAWTGLDLARGVHAHVLKDVIARRAAALGLSISAYTASVATPQHPEAARLIDFVTVCHSWFFRDTEQLAVVERLLADGPAEMNIWLAACASGEEAYTLAMLADALGRAPYLLATDINTEALARARAARYGAWSLRTLPPSFADRFTSRADGSFEVVARLRLGVELLRHNLMTPPPPSRTAAGWHLILCRNVLMYFRPADAEATIARLTNALRPGGYLILGASDILAEAPPGLRFVSLGGRYVLQRTLGDEPPRRASTHPGWHVPAPPPRVAPAPRRAPEPRRDAPLGPDALLAHGARELEAGRFADAIAQFSTAMERDPLSPEAAALTGVACFLAGDASAALTHLRRALALDPELWHAELYLAMCHDRLGAAAEAVSAYQRLHALLTNPRRSGAVSAALAPLEAWRDDALAIARQKTRRSR